MQQAIRDAFPEYRVIDCSTKGNEAIVTILKLCMANKNLIVYIRKHEHNQNYFDFLDSQERLKQFHDPRPLLEIVLNLDNFVGFRDDTFPIENKIRDIRKNLLDDDACALCFEKKSETNQIHICGSCSHSMCITCLTSLVRSQIDNGKAIKNYSTGKIEFKCPTCNQVLNATI